MRAFLRDLTLNPMHVAAGLLLALALLFVYQNTHVDENYTVVNTHVYNAVIVFAQGSDEQPILIGSSSINGEEGPGFVVVRDTQIKLVKLDSYFSIDPVGQDEIISTVQRHKRFMRIIGLKDPKFCNGCPDNWKTASVTDTQPYPWRNGEQLPNNAYVVVEVDGTPGQLQRIVLQSGVPNHFIAHLILKGNWYAIVDQEGATYAFEPGTDVQVDIGNGQLTVDSAEGVHERWCKIRQMEVDYGWNMGTIPAPNPNSVWAWPDCPPAPKR